MDPFILPENAMNFTENQQGNVILDKLRQQKEAVRFCDVVFQVNEQEFHAHRSVLAASSPYFDSMLKVNKVLKEFLPVSCNNPYVFHILLDYIYTGKVVIHDSCVSELLRLANKFMISKLKDHCCEYMERNLNVTNCFSTKDQAVRCGCASLIATVEHFITENIAMIMKQNEILEFPLSCIEGFLTSKTYALLEDQKFWIIVRWVKYDVTHRERFMSTLLVKLQWEYITLNLLNDAIKSDDLFTTSNRCLQDILESLKMYGILPDYFSDILNDLKGHEPEETETRTILELGIPGSNVMGPGHTGKVNEIKPLERVDEGGGIINIVHTAELKQSSVYNAMNTYEELAEDSEENLFDRLTIVEETPQFNTDHSESHSSTPKHQRRGSAVKVKIPKVKLKMATKHTKVPRRRGKPPKKRYSDQLKDVKKEHEGDDVSLLEDTSATQASPVVNKSIPDPGSDGEKPLHEGSEIDDVPKPKRKRRQKRNRLKCKKCDFIATCDMKLELHNQSAHKDDTPFYCHACDFSCLWNREYYRHMKSHFVGPPYTCDIDDCAHSSDRIQQILVHRLSHGNLKPFTCPECNLKFRTKNSLAAHQKLHTGKYPISKKSLHYMGLILILCC